MENHPKKIFFLFVRQQDVILIQFVPIKSFYGTKEELTNTITANHSLEFFESWSFLVIHQTFVLFVSHLKR